MKKNIKSSEVASLIKETKSKINKKYTQLSKQIFKAAAPSQAAPQPKKEQNPHNNFKKIELLFNLKNKSELVIIPQSLSYHPIKQEIIQKKQTISNNVKCKAYTLQKDVNFTVENRKSVVPKASVYLPMKGMDKNKNNQAIIVQPSLVICGQPKPISNAQQKKVITIKYDSKKETEKKAKGVEDKFGSISEASTQAQSQQLVIENKIALFNSNATESEGKGEPKGHKDGLLKITVSIRNLHEQNIKLSQLYHQIKESNQNINLRLDSYFENYQALLNFCTKFLRFGPEITYFTWNVKGYFEDDSNSNIIGELISRFTRLYRFEICIFQSSLSISAAMSFSNGLQKLTQLAILRINVQDTQGRVVEDLRSKPNSFIVKAIQSLPNLQLLLSKNKQIQFCSPSPPKMSNFIYVYNTSSTIYHGINSKKRQDIDFQKQTNMITTITLKNDNFYFQKEQPMKDTLSIFNLPYLTRLFSYKDNKRHEETVSKTIVLLRKLVFAKMRNLLQILSFQKSTKEFLPINPVMVMTDLWMD